MPRQAKPKATPSSKKTAPAKKATAKPRASSKPAASKKPVETGRKTGKAAAKATTAKTVIARKPRGPYRPRAAKVAAPARHQRRRAQSAVSRAPQTLDGFLAVVHAVFADQLALAVHQADSATRETIATLLSLRKATG